MTTFSETFYAIFKVDDPKHPWWSRRKFRALRRAPALSRGEIAVKVTLEIPEEIWQEQVPAVTIPVEKATAKGVGGSAVGA